MAKTYKVRNWDQESVFFNYTTATLQSFTPSATVRTEDFVFPLDAKTYRAIAFTMTAAEVFQNLNSDGASLLMPDMAQATDGSFIPLTEEPADWDENPVRYYTRNNYGYYFRRNNAYMAFTTDCFSAVNDQFSKQIYFENGVNFYLGQQSTNPFGTIRDGSSAWCSSQDRSGDRPQTGRFSLRYGATQLVNTVSPREIWGANTRTQTPENWADGYAKEWYLTEFEYGGKKYLGVLAVCYDTSLLAIKSGWFVGAEQTVFGEFRKPGFGPQSEEQGGQRGTFDNSSAGIGMTAHPGSLIIGNLVTNGSGFHCYAADSTAYNRMIAGFFTTDFGSLFKNFSYSPWQAVIGCYKLPCIAPKTNTSFNIRANGVQIEESSLPISAPCITDTVYQSTVSSISILPYYDSYLDFSPYTTAILYLPFVGYRDIDINKCMDGKLFLAHRIDILTGNILWYCSATDRFGHTELIGQWSGQCAVQLPVMGSTGNIGTLLGAITTGAGAAISGNPVAVIGSAANLATAGQKTDIGQTFGGNSGMLGCLQPYLIITRNVSNSPDGMLERRGMPSDLGGSPTSIGLSGLAIIDDADIQIEGVTERELQEIRSALSEGTIF